MKKIGFLVLAIVLAIGTLGVGYAHWTETLTISGDVSTGFIDVNFMSQYDNDGPDEILGDPTGPGEWDFSTIPPTWSGGRDPECKDVATTSSTFATWDGVEQPMNPTGNSARIAVANGYPSYWGSVAWDILNHGNVPVALYAVTLVELSNDTTAFVKNVELDIGTRYYVDGDTGTISDTFDDQVDDFSFILSAHGLEQLDPNTWDAAEWTTVGYLDVTVHIEQPSGQKAYYDFVIEYDFVNWNEVDD